MDNFDISTSEVVGNLEGRGVAFPPLEYGEDDQYLEEALDAELTKEGIQIVAEVLSDDITEAKEEDNYYEDDLGKPSRGKSDVFLNIVQKAFDPPPPPFI